MGVEDGRKRVLFVCKGNMCRSPMAEAVANTRWGNLMRAESGGVSAWAGEPATDHAVEMARRLLSYDLSAHRARHIRDVDLAGIDIVVAMTGEIAAGLGGGGAGGKPVVVALDIADPYLESAEVYERTLKEIERQMEDRLLPLLRRPDS